MNYVVALGALVLFAAGFRAVRIVPITADTMKHAHVAFAALADTGKSEEEKERAARAASLLLFRRFFVIAALTAAALVPSALIILLASESGTADSDAVLNALLSPWLISCALALFAAEYWFRR
jgi:hypothetical protein